MTEIELVSLIGQTGFPISVAVFLLWKGYTQDQKYLEVLQKLSTLLEEHIRQKDQAIELLKKRER